MLDIIFVRSNPDVVKENIKKKFQDEKLPLVDEVLELDQRNRDIKGEVERLKTRFDEVRMDIEKSLTESAEGASSDIKNIEKELGNR